MIPLLLVYRAIIDNNKKKNKVVLKIFSYFIESSFSWCFSTFGNWWIITNFSCFGCIRLWFPMSLDLFLVSFWHFDSCAREWVVNVRVICMSTNNSEKWFYMLCTSIFISSFSRSFLSFFRADDEVRLKSTRMFVALSTHTKESKERKKRKRKQKGKNIYFFFYAILNGVFWFSLAMKVTIEPSVMNVVEQSRGMLWLITANYHFNQI